MFEFKWPTEIYSNPAGFGVRLLAFIIDGIIFLVFRFLIGLIDNVIGYGFSDSFLFLCFIAYFIYFNYKYGRTIGKYHTELRVETLGGTQISLKSSILRLILPIIWVLLPLLLFTFFSGSIEWEPMFGGDKTEQFKFLGAFSAWFGFSIGFIILIIIDYAIILFREDKRALHDIIAGTRVMKK